jgi:hypothetical protein
METRINEIERGIIAIQLIQELLVDMCDEAGIFTRSNFEERLKDKVAELNIQIEEMNKKSKTINPMIYMSNVVGEA